MERGCWIRNYKWDTWYSILCYRRGGKYYHIDNTQTDNAHRVDLNYTGNHYNLILLPGMYEESEGKMSEEGSLSLKVLYLDSEHHKLTLSFKN